MGDRETETERQRDNETETERVGRRDTIIHPLLAHNGHMRYCSHGGATVEGAAATASACVVMKRRDSPPPARCTLA